ncbi:hypothetical protein [Serratia rhizosphaerae]|uniref:Uncharacterized protein n=1 Tax=Serratia rhizosphaerae TaxID=2597702 RepID=A0ABX6GPN9_9GAMM|nr:hypothetical protein [Serratia rhizosphaerae]QHA88197.1 hypothetical protein FO014_15205 [Serratia rhizosphaerae]
MKSRIITQKNGNGIFNRKEWVSESQKLYVSAKLLREQGDATRQRIREMESGSGEVTTLINIVSASDKSSRLLLGYAFEMLLKSAILLLNYGATKETIEKIFRDYGHKLDTMAKELGLDINEHEINLLRMVSKDILIQARYPLKVENDSEYIKEFNKLTSEHADSNKFIELVGLYDKIKFTICKLDKDSSNCANFNKYTCDEFSVFFRSGGGLRSRAIVLFNNPEFENKRKMYVKESIKNETGKFSTLFLYNWDEFEFYEDHNKKLKPID